MSVFETVKAAVTTRQAVEFYGLEVKRGGMVCCPFHQDRHPSMKVDARFHCFGCGADGDVIDFTARLYGLSKLQAAVHLAEDFGLAYSAEPRQPKPRVKSPSSSIARLRTGATGA